MPFNATVRCSTCSGEWDELLPSREAGVICTCGGVAHRVFEPTKALNMAPWAASVNDDANSRLRRYVESDAVKAQVKAGILDTVR